MGGFIAICFLLGMVIAAVIVGLAKAVITRDDSHEWNDDMDDITNPSRSWHPLNMWNDDK